MNSTFYDNFWFRLNYGDANLEDLTALDTAVDLQSTRSRIFLNVKDYKERADMQIINVKTISNFL